MRVPPTAKSAATSPTILLFFMFLLPKKVIGVKCHQLLMTPIRPLDEIQVVKKLEKTSIEKPIDTQSLCHIAFVESQTH